MINQLAIYDIYFRSHFFYNELSQSTNECVIGHFHKLARECFIFQTYLITLESRRPVFDPYIEKCAKQLTINHVSSSYVLL